MRLGWFTTLSSSVLSLILHLVVGALLILSFDLTQQPKTQIRKDVNVVQAVTVDKKQVEDELERIRKIEEEKHKKEKQRLDKLEKKAKNLEKKRKEEQVRLKKLEKEKAELKKKRELEEKKIKEAEAKAEKLRAEEKARKQKIAEEKKVAEEKKQQEKKAAERLRREKELAAELLAEETAEQASKDQELINRISSNIKRSIESKFNKVGLPDGLECVLSVRLIPGGEVIDVSIAQSSGNDIFDRRAVNATQKASPLPVPEDVATFERLDLRDNNITFKPTN